jgi:hypothetical protein
LVHCQKALYKNDMAQCLRVWQVEPFLSLETAAFINALTSFMARRGQVREIRSDQGTNLAGAEK